jgi:hypothetical protein
MEGQSREEYIGSVRRRSSGFSRGVSKYRGVARFSFYEFALNFWLRPADEQSFN